jgi:hypothetical protein
MSGDLQYRVNRSWLDSTQANVAHKHFFWDFLHFINDHVSMNIIAYGTGTTQEGSSTPTSWLTWDDPAPMSSNAWFVFEANLASEYLNASGSLKWQCKIQVADESSFDDPSGSDYGKEGDSNAIVCLRLSVDGGWNSGTLDFEPISGSGTGNNHAIFKVKNIDYYCHFIGDNDTLWWTGRPSIGTFSQNRGGYLGIINRRTSDIVKPCISMVGAISNAVEASYGEDAHICKDTSFNHQFSYGATNSQWPSHHLATDGLTSIDGTGKLRLESWNVEILQNMGVYKYTNESYVLRILLAEYVVPDNCNVLGELRLIGACGIGHGEGTLFGTDNDYMQIAHSPDTFGGIAMQWPIGQSASF